MLKKIKNVKFLIIFICALCIFTSCLVFNFNSLTANADDVTEVTSEQERDNDILKYHREPTLDENFEDDTVNVILKSGYSGEIGLDDFNAINDLYKISSITYKLKTLYSGSNEKFTLDENKNAIITLKLTRHDKAAVLKAVKKLQKSDFVLTAEPNYIYEAVSNWVPDDAYYYGQWGLNGTNGIDAENAWNITTGGYHIKVGLFENDVDINHEDLKGQIYYGNYTGSSVERHIIHGTLVAGIIGAIKDEYGVSGVANCTMYLLDRSSNKFVSSLEYAEENGIKVINASYGYLEDENKDIYAAYNSTHYAAIKNYDGLLVCAAGNSKRDTDSIPVYPACYDLPNVISVGNIDKKGERFSSSNYGVNTVDIYAPGASILSTYPLKNCLNQTCDSIYHHENGYHYDTGTSMAAPHVTGVAALLLSLNSYVSASRLKDIILSTADTINIKVPDNPVGFLTQTVKKLNAYKAVSKLNNELNSNLNKKYNIIIDKIQPTMPSGYTLDKQILGYMDTYSFTADESSTYNNDVKYFSEWITRLNVNDPDSYDSGMNPWITVSTDRTLSFTVRDIIYRYHQFYDEKNDIIYIRAAYREEPPSCVAEDTLITLGDGTQKLVKDLTGEESLLVWNLFTGTFDTAPILFIDSEPAKLNEVVNLYFSDGTTVKVISEHGFWDVNLNRYVYLKNDASQYIGHWFLKQDIANDEFYNAEVQLTDVIIQEEYTAAYSPVTYGHLCYFVDGMLSVPGGIDGLFNIFEVDSETLKYDEAAYLRDIETYGLYTYEEFNGILPVAEELFEAVNGQYLKVAVGKGLIDFNTLAGYIDRYSRLLN